jgi:RNA polymerase sigma-70 factor (ECF subfamily)
MHEDTSARTSVTLLDQLRLEPQNQAAWEEFFRRYHPRIYVWCRRWNLQPADAEEVTQNVLLKLVAKLGDFRYDASRSFRAWLKTLTQHAWIDYLDGLKNRGAGGEESANLLQLQSIAARDDLVQRLKEEYDQELADLAMARVRERVEPQTWEAFRLTRLMGLSGSEAASRIPMKESMVFVACSRVLKLIREEVQNFERQTEGTAKK